MKIEKNKFSERLKLLRLKNGLSQRELANLIGVKRSNISKWETAEVEPKFSTLLKITYYFKVTVNYILGIE